MNAFSITVRSEKEDKRIPIAVASDVMFDVQLLIAHIGESFIAEEFGSYERPAEALVERFTLYIDPEGGGISFKASAGKGQSALMEKALGMLRLTLEKMGSGSGTYWMEDNFKDPRYRSLVLYDLIQLSKHMARNRGYAMLFGADGKEKRFEPIDIDKAQIFLEKNARITNGSVVGIMHSIQSKRNVPVFSFVVGDDRVKISFRTKDAEGDAAACLSGAALVKGILRYSEDGELLEVSDITSVEPFIKKTMRHMISAERDIPLAVSVEADVRYDNATMIWKLSYPDLGISVSDLHWDRAVAGFHDYFVFLCDNYLTKDRSAMTDEEKDVVDVLHTLTDRAE